MNEFLTQIKKIHNNFYPYILSTDLVGSNELNEQIQNNYKLFFITYLQIKLFKYKNVKLEIKNDNLYWNKLDKVDINQFPTIKYLCFNVSRDIFLYTQELIEDCNNFFA